MNKRGNHLRLCESCDSPLTFGGTVEYLNARIHTRVEIAALPPVPLPDEPDDDEVIWLIVNYARIRAHGVLVRELQHLEIYRNPGETLAMTERRKAAYSFRDRDDDAADYFLLDLEKDAFKRAVVVENYLWIDCDGLSLAVFSLRRSPELASPNLHMYGVVNNDNPSHLITSDDAQWPPVSHAFRHEALNRGRWGSPRYVPRCSCGWRGLASAQTIEAAQRIYQQHLREATAHW